MRAPAASLGAPAQPAAAPAAAPAASPPSRPIRAPITGPEFVDPDAEDDAPAAARGSASSLASPIEAAKTERRNAESSQADAEIARWDARIQEVQREMSQARDQRTRAVLGNLLANLVLTASRVLTGTRGSSTIPMRQDAFDERARERLSDRSREWSATDDMILRAQELREGQRTRATEADLRSRREQRESQTLDLARIREERTTRIAEARQRLAEAESETERREAMLELQRNDPESAESERARRRYVASAMARERALGPAGRSAIDLETEVRGLAATDIEAMEGELASMTVGTRTSRAGGGGSRGVRMADGSDMSIEQFREVYRQRTGRSNAEADVVYANPRSRQQFLNQLADIPAEAPAAPDERGRELIPGVFVNPEMVDDVTARARRASLINASTRYGALAHMGEVASRYGASGAINPQAQAEIEADLRTLMAMVADMQQTGIINPGEMPAIRAALPDPTSIRQSGLGTFQAQLGSFQRTLEAGVYASLRADGADEESVGAALQYLRGGSSRSGPAQRPAAAPDAPTGGAQYRVTNREGRTITRTLTPEQLRTFRAGGFTIEEVR